MDIRRRHLTFILLNQTNRIHPTAKGNQKPPRSPCCWKHSSSIPLVSASSPSNCLWGTHSPLPPPPLIANHSCRQHFLCSLIFHLPWGRMRGICATLTHSPIQILWCTFSMSSSLVISFRPLLFPPPPNQLCLRKKRLDGFVGPKEEECQYPPKTILFATAKKYIPSNFPICIFTSFSFKWEPPLRFGGIFCWCFLQFFSQIIIVQSNIKSIHYYYLVEIRNKKGIIL